MFALPQKAPYDPSSGPRNMVVLLLDSLNRHLLGAYGSDEFDTPNLDRFAARSIRFDRHYSASLPCMPARHDLLCGSWDFLWRPWGSIEIWENAITQDLRMHGVQSQLISDHPHLFETGGENYHCDFGAWDYVRGHEGDAWKLRPDPSYIGTPALPAAEGMFRRGYDTSRTYFKAEADYPGPKTMAATADWLDHNAPHFRANDDRFFLFVDEFDPHEPFDTPEPWTYKYHDQRDVELTIWPPYNKNAVGNGALTEAQAVQVRANYGAKLSMIDHWFGKVLDAMDRNDLWADTAVVLCTDHGHYLGDNGGAFGKPSLPIYNTLGHIPMIVAWPGAEPGQSSALTTTVDVHATIAEVFGVDTAHRTHGVSLKPLLDGSRESVRDWLLQGYFGREVNVIDADGKYIRTAPNGPYPLSVWSNRWSTMPVHALPRFGLPKPDNNAYLDKMPGSDIPVLRQPFTATNHGAHPFMGMRRAGGQHLLFDADDQTETEDLCGSAREAHYIELLRHALDAVDAPAEQSQRLALAGRDA
ncbi:MAG: sulfatase [Acidimicrobiales bacterium]|nr:sulfatase [Acidimicrobiales bacterium]